MPAFILFDYTFILALNYCKRSKKYEKWQVLGKRVQERVCGVEPGLNVLVLFCFVAIPTENAKQRILIIPKKCN